MIACGIPSFTKFIRDDVRRFTSRHNIIEFVEVEYRPQGPHDYQRSKYLLEKRDTELQNLTPHQHLKQPELAKNVLRRACTDIENAVRVEEVSFV